MAALWHRLMHRIGWNRTRPDGDGFTCCGCGRHTPWEH